MYTVSLSGGGPVTMDMFVSRVLFGRLDSVLHITVFFSDCGTGLSSARIMQARIQSKILENISKVASLERVPEDAFERFAMGRYEARLQEAVENGLIQQEELKQYTEEDTVRNYIAGNRGTLEKEFTVILAIDEIYKREGLQADQAAVNEQLESRSEEFKKSGKIVTVRSPVDTWVHAYVALCTPATGMTVLGSAVSRRWNMYQQGICSSQIQ